MKSKKRKINVKRVIILIVLLLIIIAGIVLAINKLTSKENTTKEVKEVASIDAYGYTLRDNATAYYKKLFKELEKTLNADKVDEDKYSELVAKMFIADFFNLDNKISKMTLVVNNLSIRIIKMILKNMLWILCINQLKVMYIIIEIKNCQLLLMSKSLKLVMNLIHMEKTLMTMPMFIILKLNMKII